MAGPIISVVYVTRQIDLLLMPAGVTDSKKLSETARENLYLPLILGAHDVGMGWAHPWEVDTLTPGIALQLSYQRALEELRRSPDLLIVEDFGHHRLSSQQSNDVYELIIERYRQSSFVFTSHRGVDKWLGLFKDPILGNSALDRLAHGAYQLVIEGTSYRAKKAPKISNED